MKRYNPKAIESRRYAEWEAAGHFAPSGQGQAFSIAIPPPNVTGTLHMGHAFQHSLVDALVRFKRMDGCNTLWQMGTDHAGIATQLLVTEQLAAEGQSPQDLGREAFIKKVWEWKETSGGAISWQLRRLGASLHWQTERFTLDPGLSAAVLEVFVRLHDEGLIYKGKRLVNWDPSLKSSLSDLEVEATEEEGQLWHFRYPLADEPAASLTVATTRPETLLGDTALAVHPEDERYRHLVGRAALLPLAERRIPIIADSYVDRDFGTGCVKITPAHDFNDYAVGQRHQLPMVNVLTEDGRISDAAPAQYRGLDRFEARKQVVADMQALGLLAKVEPHRLAVPRAERSGVVVEPYLSDQWYVRVAALAAPAVKAVQAGKIAFIPKQAENIYFAWMREIEDWCISRQQWWGHRIPAWYDPDGKAHVARSEAEARQKHKLAADLPLQQDPDVLDTWFSSALWTFSTLGWPEKTEALKTFHPTSVLVTGHDIISFWVSRMIMMTLKFCGEPPFRKVYIHGLVTDADGQKMSKSKGNGLDPMDIIDGISADALVEKRTGSLMQPRMAGRIEKATRKEYPEGIMAYGADSLRFTFCALSGSARKVRFDLKRVEGYRNFCNKLWNAAAFVQGHLQGESLQGEREPSLADRWILSELQGAIRRVREAMDTWRFDLAAKAIYEFVWSEFCDWYLELAKALLKSPEASEAEKRAARHTLATALEASLRLAHPFMPFITEELWQGLPAEVRGPAKDGRQSLMLAPYPSADRQLLDKQASADIAWLKQVVTGVRNLRGELDISPARPVPVLFAKGGKADRRRLKDFTGLLTALVRPERLEWLEGKERPLAATQLLDGLELLVPMAGLIDKQAELARLDKALARQRQEQQSASAKLANPDFTGKAPAAVVQEARARVAALDAALAKLEAQRDQVASL